MLGGTSIHLSDRALEQDHHRLALKEKKTKGNSLQMRE